MKLLIVDDHTETRALIRDFVGHLADEVHECGSGAAAMRHCLDNLPDVVTLDLRNADADGVAVLEFLRNVCPSVHTVVVTQFDEPEVRTLVRRMGAARCFAKSDLPGLRDHLERRSRAYQRNRPGTRAAAGDRSPGTGA
jgi:DNA-binding response OmpR family regulator